LKIEIPPLSEQRKIAYILNTIQKAIEQQDKLIKTTTELKKALMQKLFTEGTKGEKQKQTEIGLVPESWQIKTIRSIAIGKFQNGAFVQNPKKGEGLLFANVVDMYRELYLDLSKLERFEVNKEEVSQYLLRENDILFVRSSLKREGIGQNCIAKNLTETVFYDCHLIRVRPDPEVVVAEFMSYYFASALGKQELIKRSKTTTMTTINQDSLGGTFIPIPNIKIQNEIVQVGLNVDKKIAFHKRKKQTLTDLFKTFLHQLMTGQRRVNELEFETLTKEYAIEQEPLSMVAEN
jgi:type I restriction enzyme, S subunit